MIERTRRDRRSAALAGALAAALLSCGAAPSAAAQPARAPLPNILWLVSEDNNPFIGAYGDGLARTPAIDRLAREGLLFRNAYSTAPVCAPSRFAIITGVHPESCAPANHMRARATLPSEIRAIPEHLRRAGYYCTNNAKTDYNCDIDPAAVWDESSARAHWRGRPTGRPFFAVFNFETTHESSIFVPLEGRVKPTDVRVPGYLPDTPDVRRDIATYYNRIDELDGKIAGRLAELAADGLAEETIVFYYSDNGGVLPRSKRHCYDAGLRTALIVRLPERWAHLAPAKPGSTIATPVSLVDLAPTVLALAGVARPSVLQGRAFLGDPSAGPRRFAFGMRNRMDERYDFVRTATDGRYRYIRNYMPHRPWGQHQAYAWLAHGYQDWERQFRAGRLDADRARFFGEKPFEELYDLEFDPDQLRNRIDDPALAREADELRRALSAHMREINDNGFIPEGSPLEGYVASRVPGAYPLEPLMELAAVAARREPAGLDLLRGRLADGNEAVRYWAAQGLLMLGRAAAPALASLRTMMRSDASLPVRIVAAEAVAGLENPEEAVSVLAGLAERSHPTPIRLQALNALTFLGEKSRSALPAIVRASEDDQVDVCSAGRYLRAVLEGRYDPSYPVIDLERLRATWR